MKPGAKPPSKSAKKEMLASSGISAPSESRARLPAGGAPVTVKPAPGSAWNVASSEGSLAQSCAYRCSFLKE
jgi:hypothetical protein